MMQQVVIERAGSYEQLQIKEKPDLTPTQGQLVIDCKACGVNFADCCVRMGVYSSAKVYKGWPITPGFEVAGAVRAIGAGVHSFQVGDRVIACTRFDGYSSQLCVPEAYVLPLPQGFSFEQGASIPSVFLTAYYGLIEKANPRKGERVLIHSAAGGVGSALIQLAKLKGCHVTAVVGAAHKVEAARSLGADAVIDKSTEALWPSAEAIQADGFDIVLDANGAETLSQSYAHLAPGGRLVVYGFHTMLSKGRGQLNWLKAAWDYLRTPRFNPLEMTSDNRSVLAFNLSYLFDKIDYFQETLGQILEWFETGALQFPSITTYPIRAVQEAHKALESGKTVGKIVLIP